MISTRWRRIVPTSGVEFDMEIIWQFWKTDVSNASKINVSISLCAEDNNSHSLIAPVRIDFDIDDLSMDRQFIYGLTGWEAQNTETFQFTYTPVDSTWGMKVRQEDGNGDNRWGGEKAWSTSEQNYLLNYYPGLFDSF